MAARLRVQTRSKSSAAVLGNVNRLPLVVCVLVLILTVTGCAPTESSVDRGIGSARMARASNGSVAVTATPYPGAFPDGGIVNLAWGEDGPESLAPSQIGGPVHISEQSGAQPSAPVEVVFRMAPEDLAAVELPIIVHHSETVGVWFAEPTSVDLVGGTVSATLDSFSWMDVVDGITLFGGRTTGNRADSGPTGCGTPPDWVDGILAYNGENDPLRTCLSTTMEGDLAVHVVNNRGYPITLTLEDASPRVVLDATVPGDTVSLLAALIAEREPAATVIHAGGGATLIYERPDPGQHVTVHVEARTDALSYWTETMGAALSGFVANGLDSRDPRIQAWNHIRGQIAEGQGNADCLLTVASTAAVPPRDASSAAAALSTCSDQFQEVMRQEGVDGRIIGAFSKYVKAMAVTDVSYKLIDRAADPVNGAQFEFALHGKPIVNTLEEFSSRSGVFCDLDAADEWGYTDAARVAWCYVPDPTYPIAIGGEGSETRTDETCPQAVGFLFPYPGSWYTYCLDWEEHSAPTLEPASKNSFGSWDCVISADVVKCAIRGDESSFRIGNQSCSITHGGTNECTWESVFGD